MANEKGLVGVTIYETAEQHRKYTHTTTRERDDGVSFDPHFDGPIDTRVCEWLEQNTLGSVTARIPGESFLGVQTYLLMGSNNTFCAIHSDRVDVEQPTIFRGRDHVYKMKVTIRSQPVGRELPCELTEVLESFGFKKVEPAEVAAPEPAAVAR